MRFVPRLAELRDGSEARAFFAADSRRCRFWNPSAADLDLKDLRLRFPLGSNQGDTGKREPFVYLGLALPSYIKLVFKWSVTWLRSTKRTVQKTIRILGVSLALIVLLVFATGVVSDWNHQGANDDARCPYCHLGHQTPAQLVVTPSVSLLKPVASLPLPQDTVLATGPVFSQTSPRAPPSA